MIDFLKEAESIKDELIGIRRDIHMHPELGLNERRTSKVIQDFLKSHKIEFSKSAGTGVIGIINGRKETNRNKKVIAIRADMDALPLEDKKTCSYKSKIKGKMHGCGHDAHTAMLLGIAKIINNHKDDFYGSVKLIFEPAEETVGGAKIMIEEGALKNPEVNGIIGLHVSEDVPVGKIEIKDNMVNASSNVFSIKIKGIGGHGAHPSTCIDPIIISSIIIQSIQNIITREISRFSPTVISICSINGGEAYNVIPDEVTLKGIIRTINKEDRKYVIKRFVEMVTKIAESFRAKVDINIEEGYPCLYNNSHMVSLLRRSAESIIGKENIISKEYPSMGVESFAYFAEKKPAVFYYLGTKNILKGTDKPAHGNYFDIDEDAIPIGVAIQCKFAFDYLTS